MTDKNDIDKFPEATKKLACDESQETFKEKLEKLTKRMEDDGRELSNLSHQMLEDELELKKVAKKLGEAANKGTQD